MVFEDVQADGSVAVDVWVVDSSSEGAFWRFERVVSWEVDVEEEDTSLVRRVTRPHDSGLPMEEVTVIDGSC